MNTGHILSASHAGSFETASGRLRRVYRLHGLDRVLYTGPAIWPEGAFTQVESESGELTLVLDHVTTRPALDAAIAALDARAERFRVAMSFNTGCPLTHTLLSSDEPDVDPPGVLSARATTSVTATADMQTEHRAKPAAFPQLPLESARWIHTLTEVRRLGGFPDEAVKRCYLIVEELWDSFATQATPVQTQQVAELKWVRHFVSHNECTGLEVCTFIAAQLPSAVMRSLPLRVRFDRTQIEHMNLAGRYQPIGEALARTLIGYALAHLTP